MVSSSIFSFTALVTCVVARHCFDLTIPVSLTARNAVFDLEPLLTEVAVTDFYLNLARQGTNYTDELLTGYDTFTRDYDLAVTYCEPDSGPGHVLQIMTHGIGFDRSYFDLPIQDRAYSYVDRAVGDYGYSTLTWDRLGVGESSRGNPINEIQIFLEIAALRKLTLIFASGLAHGISHPYDRIVHVGHSFGSAMTYALVAQTPEISEGIVLTGYSQVPDYLGHFAVGGNFVPVSSISSLASKYPPGYVGAGSRMGVHINFFAPGDFDEDVLDHLYKNGQPNTPGEILTVGAGGSERNPFPGPVMFIIGERDVPFCGGDCFATSIIDNSASTLIDASRSFFPGASAFNATVVPAAGHGLFLGHSAPSAFEAILNFLDTQL